MLLGVSYKDIGGKISHLADRLVQAEVAACQKKLEQLTVASEITFGTTSEVVLEEAPVKAPEAPAAPTPSAAPAEGQAEKKRTPFKDRKQRDVKETAGHADDRSDPAHRVRTEGSRRDRRPQDRGAGRGGERRAAESVAAPAATSAPVTVTPAAAPVTAVEPAAAAGAVAVADPKAPRRSYATASAGTHAPAAPASAATPAAVHAAVGGEEKRKPVRRTGSPRTRPEGAARPASKPRPAPVAAPTPAPAAPTPAPAAPIWS